MKQADIIEITGINKGSISSYLSGRYKPKQDSIYLLAQALNVSETWLMGLDVPMEPVRNDLLPNCQRTLTQDESDLLDDFQKLNADGKSEARKQVRNLTKIEDYTKDTGSSASAAG